MALAEDEEIYIGNPFSLLVVPRSPESSSPGEIWVSDFYANVLLQFDGTGRFVRRLGGPGTGPHEFTTIGQLFLTDDEVGAVELRRREVKWFRRADGAYLRGAQFQTGSIGISPPVAVDGGRGLAFPLLDPVSRTSVAILDAASGTWTRGGSLPDAYRRSLDRGRGAFASYFRYVYLDALDPSALLLAFSGVDSLYRHEPGRAATSAIGGIPRRSRRGLEGECRFAGDAPDPAMAMRECGNPRELFSPVSGAWRLGDGRLAVVHTDQRSEGVPPRVVVTGTSYLTVLDPAGDAACVDLRIPGGSDARAVHDLKAGTLFVLDRRVTGERSTLWLLAVPVPSIGDCPREALVRGWRAAPS